MRMDWRGTYAGGTRSGGKLGGGVGGLNLSENCRKLWKVFEKSQNFFSSPEGQNYRKLSGNYRAYHKSIYMVKRYQTVKLSELSVWNYRKLSGNYRGSIFWKFQTILDQAQISGTRPSPGPAQSGQNQPRPSPSPGQQAKPSPGPAQLVPLFEYPQMNTSICDWVGRRRFIKGPCPMWSENPYQCLSESCFRMASFPRCLP